MPGDVIELSAGNLVPADGVVLECRDFLVSQASLTGGSFPVEKAAGQLPADASLPQRTNSVFLGTSVRSGTAKALIVDTGLRTEFGRIAGRLASAAPETEFANGLRQFGYLLTRVMMVMVLFVLTINLLFRDRWSIRCCSPSRWRSACRQSCCRPSPRHAVVRSSALGQKGVIVRRLEAIENLGSIDFLCTDKTGTMTEGRSWI